MDYLLHHCKYISLTLGVDIMCIYAHNEQVSGVGVGVSIGESLARAVRDRRESLRLSQTEAATRAGLSVAVWSHVETMRSEAVRTRTARQMSEALGWTPDSIERLARGEEPVEAVPERPAVYASTADGAPLSERELAIVKSAVTEALAQIKREQGGQP